MRMDISYWKSKNSSVKFEETTKQYFGKYLYRLRLSVPGGRIIHENRDYGVVLAERKHHRMINPGGYWGRPAAELNNVDISLLTAVRRVRDNNPNVKIRIEEPEVQFYAKTEDELKQLVDQLYVTHRYAVKSIAGPASDDTKQLLKQGVIIRKKQFGYQYKIVLRDGRCDIATKLQILNYLESLGPDEAHVSVGVKSALQSKYNGFWGIWFYANDEKVTTFLELIHPGAVLNIHPVVVV